jgi:hypothetical protein
MRAMLTLATVLVGYALSKLCQTLINTLKQNKRTQTHKQRTVNDNGDTVRKAKEHRETYRTAKHNTVVKNQHWAEK